MAQTNPGADPDSLTGVSEFLRDEYGTLFGALTATWQVSVARTTLLLGVGSAFSVAIGLVAQATAFGAGFFAFALVLLPVLLFLGLTTFVRVVHAARESVVYTLGMNRIRAYFAAQIPDAAPYLVLPTHDRSTSMYESPGSGMSGEPRFRLIYALVQLPGVVSVVNGVIAGATVALVLGLYGLASALMVGSSLLVGVAVVALLLAYWRRSMSEMMESMERASKMPGDPG